MRDSADSIAWVSLAHAPGLDAPTVCAALEILGTPRALLGATAAVYDRAGIPAIARAFLAAATEPLPAVRHWLETPSHHVLPCDDVRFPSLLRAAPDCPIALYVRGQLDALAEPQLAVVGSRNPTPQGRGTAFEFAASLAERGVCICSGLAEGIDSSAHRGALSTQGITVAVLGTGIDQTYPPGHAPLCEDIVQRGALLSEFPLGTPPRRGNFPRRNRIIAGLSLGTLVVEAARRSGSLITARWANTYGREVFAIPGSIHNPLSRGCHELIRSGATLVESAADILRELNFSAFFSNDFRALPGAGGRVARAAGMDKDHKILLDALGFDPVDLDSLVVRTGFKPEAVSSMMLILELEGHVQAAPGGRYSRAAYRRAGGER